MKSNKIPLLCLATLILHSITYAQKKYNLNFDNFNSEKNSMPDGWFKGRAYKNLNGENIRGEKLNDENYVGKVVSDKKGKVASIIYKIPAKYIGDTIRLTGRMKYEGVKEFTGFLMRIHGYGNNGILALESMQKLKIRGTNDWKEYYIEMPFPNNAKYILISGFLVGKGTTWFDDFKITIDGKDIETIKETPKKHLKNYNVDKLNLGIRKSSVPINLSTDDDLSLSLDSLIEKLSNKTIVSIGESTHGTSEFYKIREIITKRLIKEKRFKVIVLENPYDDIELLNKKILKDSLDNLMQKHLFSIYQTKEMKSFLQWYKENKANYDISFKGCDDSRWAFCELLNDNIKFMNDKKLNKLLKELESNITKSTTINSSQEYKINSSIYNNIIAIEKHLKLTGNLNEYVKEILFNGKNTYVNYSRDKKRVQSRDEIMADRISYLSKSKSDKIIVWAHNAHISNEIISRGIGKMGSDLKQEFGNDYHSIGLSTLKGSYSYIDEKIIGGDNIYTDELKKTDMQLTEKPLWEKSLAINGSAFYLNLLALKKELNTEIVGPTRFLGYAKETKKDIYPLFISNNFDSLIFIENTNATTSILDKN